MNSILKFIFGSKNTYIGLSSFKAEADRKPEIKKDINIKPEKTSLTGLLRKAN